MINTEAAKATQRERVLVVHPSQTEPAWRPYLLTLQSIGVEVRVMERLDGSTVPLDRWLQMRYCG